MPNFESPHNNHELDLKQSSTKHGREIEYAKRIELRKESAEEGMDDLLIFLTEKFGREVTLAQLPAEFGELGQSVVRHFQSVMNTKEEGQSIIDLAHLTSATNALREKMEGLKQ
jgi:hypothetical protein